ncbi:hypothetical protein IAU60_006897 [Kwoniella sp. DSM 27419]
MEGVSFGLNGPAAVSRRETFDSVVFSDPTKSTAVDEGKELVQDMQPTLRSGVTALVVIFGATNSGKTFTLNQIAHHLLELAAANATTVLLDMNEWDHKGDVHRLESISYSQDGVKGAISTLRRGLDRRLASTSDAHRSGGSKSSRSILSVKLSLDPKGEGDVREWHIYDLPGKEHSQSTSARLESGMPSLSKWINECNTHMKDHCNMIKRGKIEVSQRENRRSGRGLQGIRTLIDQVHRGAALLGIGCISPAVEERHRTTTTLEIASAMTKLQTKIRLVTVSQPSIDCSPPENITELLLLILVKGIGEERVREFLKTIPTWSKPEALDKIIMEGVVTSEDRERALIEIFRSLDEDRARSMHVTKT